MKKKLFFTIAGTIMIVAFTTGCGKDTSTTHSSNTTEVATETVDVISEEDSSTDNEIDILEYAGELYSVKYTPSTFTYSKEGDADLFSFSSATIQPSFQNYVQITEKKGSTYEAVRDEILAPEAQSSIEQVTFGSDAVTAYHYTTGTLVGEGDGTKNCITYYIIPNGNDVVLVEITYTGDNDSEDVQLAVSDAIAELLNSFTLN